MKGLQVNYFSKNSQDDCVSKEYKVTKLTDRMGMRLEGVKLENTVNINFHILNLYIISIISIYVKKNK